MKLPNEVFKEPCETGMLRFPDKYFDLAIVDPPWAIKATEMPMGSSPRRKDGKGHAATSTAMRTKQDNKKLCREDIHWDNKVPGPEYWQELFRVSRNQIVWGGNYFALPATRCVICWDKKQPWEDFSGWEMAWTSFNLPSPIYRISNTGGPNNDRKIHPTQKPIALYDRCFRDFAVPGMRVLDTHVGSGSSRISAFYNHLEFIGFEISKIHYPSQEKRFKLMTQQIKLL